jgi:hypothetical protein
VTSIMRDHMENRQVLPLGKREQREHALSAPSRRERARPNCMTERKV